MMYMIEYESVMQLDRFVGKTRGEFDRHLADLKDKGLLIEIEDEDPKVSPAFLIRYYERHGYVAAYPQSDEHK